MYSTSLKAVCYQCSYEGHGQPTHCPVCNFPMILEPESTPPGGRRLSEIFSRTSVQTGAPPLPGVDPQKRQAQLMAEARRARLAQKRQAPAAAPDAASRAAAQVAPAPAQELADADAAPARRSWLGAFKVTLLCASAIAAGVLAAALQSSVL